jgi:hypothetical protein
MEHGGGGRRTQDQKDRTSWFDAAGAFRLAEVLLEDEVGTVHSTEYRIEL